MNIGDRISYLRKQKELSQTDLAKEIGASRESISKYERNEASPSVEIAKKIAAALDVTLDYLVGESNKKTFDKQTVKRMEEIEKLPEDTQKTVFNLIDMAIGYTKTKKAMAS